MSMGPPMGNDGYSAEDIRARVVAYAVAGEVDPDPVDQQMIQPVNVVRSQADAERETVEGQKKRGKMPEPRILGEGQITFEAWEREFFPQDGIENWDTLPGRVKEGWKKIEQAVIDAYEGSPSRSAVLPERHETAE